MFAGNSVEIDPVFQPDSCHDFRPAPFIFPFHSVWLCLKSTWIFCLYSFYLSQLYRVFTSYQFFIHVTTSLDCLNEPLPPNKYPIKRNLLPFDSFVVKSSQYHPLLSFNSEYVITICHFTVRLCYVVSSLFECLICRNYSCNDCVLAIVIKCFRKLKKF